MDEGISKKEKHEEESQAAQPPMQPTVAHTKSEQKEIQQKSDQGNPAQNQKGVTKWARLKTWFCKITIAEFGMLVFTFAIMLSSIAYTLYTKKQLKVAGDQLRIAKDTYSASNRPWIGVQDNVIFDETNIGWVGEKGREIVQKMTSENQLPIRVLYPLKNSGYGPAFNVMLVIQPLMFSQAGSDEAQIRTAIEKSCQIAEDRILHGNGDLVLPGGEHTVPYQFGTWDSTKFVFTPGCIVYRDVDGGLHHTRICYAAALFVTPSPKGLESCQDQSAD
jgi:hypothetical protein